jgi:hypothetical protein
MRFEPADVLPDGRIVSPSAERNKRPIAELLMRVLPEQGDVLEVSSGTGQHVLHFAQAMPHICFQPTEPDADNLKSIASWLASASLPNVNAPIRLDVHDEIWPVGKVAAVVCLNMIHIAPQSTTEALLRGAARVMDSGGILFLYGPYRRQGRHTSAGNEAFDELLRARNPEWGVRNLEDVALLAASEGLELQKVHDMPANNLAIILSKA